MAVFNEDTRVKIPATIQFLRLGYDYQSLKDADIDFQTKIFMNRFKPALEKVNGRNFSYDEIKDILMDKGWKGPERTTASTVQASAPTLGLEGTN